MLFHDSYSLRFTHNYNGRIYLINFSFDIIKCKCAFLAAENTQSFGGDTLSSVHGPATMRRITMLPRIRQD